MMAQILYPTNERTTPTIKKNENETTHGSQHHSHFRQQTNHQHNNSHQPHQKHHPTNKRHPSPIVRKSSITNKTENSSSINKPLFLGHTTTSNQCDKEVSANITFSTTTSKKQQQQSQQRSSSIEFGTSSTAMNRLGRGGGIMDGTNNDQPRNVNVRDRTTDTGVFGSSSGNEHNGGGGDNGAGGVAAQQPRRSMVGRFLSSTSNKNHDDHHALPFIQPPSAGALPTKPQLEAHQKETKKSFTLSSNLKHGGKNNKQGTSHNDNNGGGKQVRIQEPVASTNSSNNKRLMGNIQPQPATRQYHYSNDFEDGTSISCFSTKTEEQHQRLIQCFQDEIQKLLKRNKRLEVKLRIGQKQQDAARQETMDAVQRATEQSLTIVSLEEENTNLRKRVAMLEQELSQRQKREEQLQQQMSMNQVSPSSYVSEEEQEQERRGSRQDNVQDEYYRSEDQRRGNVTEEEEEAFQGGKNNEDKRTRHQDEGHHLYDDDEHYDDYGRGRSYFDDDHNDVYHGQGHEEHEEDEYHHGPSRYPHHNEEQNYDDHHQGHNSHDNHEDEYYHAQHDRRQHGMKKPFNHDDDGHYDDDQHDERPRRPSADHRRSHNYRHAVDDQEVGYRSSSTSPTPRNTRAPRRRHSHCSGVSSVLFDDFPPEEEEEDDYDDHRRRSTTGKSKSDDRARDASPRRSSSRNNSSSTDADASASPRPDSRSLRKGGSARRPSLKNKSWKGTSSRQMLMEAQNLVREGLGATPKQEKQPRKCSISVGSNDDKRDESQVTITTSSNTTSTSSGHGGFSSFSPGASSGRSSLRQIGQTSPGTEPGSPPAAVAPLPFDTNPFGGYNSAASKEDVRAAPFTPDAKRRSLVHEDRQNKNNGGDVNTSSKTFSSTGAVDTAHPHDAGAGADSGTTPNQTASSYTPFGLLKHAGTKILGRVGNNNSNQHSSTEASTAANGAPNSPTKKKSGGGDSTDRLRKTISIDRPASRALHQWLEKQDRKETRSWDQGGSNNYNHHHQDRGIYDPYYHARHPPSTSTNNVHNDLIAIPEEDANNNGVNNGTMKRWPSAPPKRRSTLTPVSYFPSQSPMMKSLPKSLTKGTTKTPAVAHNGNNNKNTPSFLSCSKNRTTPAA